MGVIEARRSRNRLEKGDVHGYGPKKDSPRRSAPKESKWHPDGKIPFRLLQPINIPFCGNSQTWAAGPWKLHALFAGAPVVRSNESSLFARNRMSVPPLLAGELCRRWARRGKAEILAVGKGSVFSQVYALLTGRGASL